MWGPGYRREITTRPTHHIRVIPTLAVCPPAVGRASRPLSLHHATRKARSCFCWTLVRSCHPSVLLVSGALWLHLFRQNSECCRHTSSRCCCVRTHVMLMVGAAYRYITYIRMPVLLFPSPFIAHALPAVLHTAIVPGCHTAVHTLCAMWLHRPTTGTLL